MSKGRGGEAQVPIYSLLPQPIYTPPDHGQRHMDHRNPQQTNPRGISTDAYRDPPFDYQKMMRYEPDMPKERYPWDHGQGPHGRDGRYGHQEYPGYGPNGPRQEGYVKIYHHESPREQDPHGYHDQYPGRDDYYLRQHAQHQLESSSNNRLKTEMKGHLERLNSFLHQDSTHQFGTHHQQGAGYDRMPPAGLATKYDVKLTDLLTSVMDRTEPDTTVRQMMEENKGYIVIARFVKEELATFINAVQATVSILASYEGYVIGFAQPQDITMSLMSHADHANNSWLHGGQFAVCCFWFKHIRRAKEFFEGTNPFRQHEFPHFTKYDIIGVPLTYGRNEDSLPLSPDSSPPTLLWAEFPSISERHPNDFLQHYADPMRRLIHSHRGHPHVTICKVKAGWPAELNKFGQDGYRVLNVHSERVGRNVHNGWLKPDSFVTVSAFQSRDQLLGLLHDPQFASLRNTLSNYTSPTMVGITLHYVSGTRLNR